MVRGSGRLRMWRSGGSGKLERLEVRSKGDRWWERGDQGPFREGRAAEAWRWKGRVQLTLQKSHIPVPRGTPPPCPVPLKMSEAGGQRSWKNGLERGPGDWQCRMGGGEIGGGKKRSEGMERWGEGVSGLEEGSRKQKEKVVETEGLGSRGAGGGEQGAESWVVGDGRGGRGRA